MKRSIVAATTVVALAIAAVGWSTGTAAGGSPGEPARANLPAANRTPPARGHAIPDLLPGQR